MSVQVLKIDWPFGAEPPKLFCPACGTLVDDENEHYCEHVEFIFIPETDDFHYESDGFKEISEVFRNAIDNAEEDSDESLVTMHEKLLELDDQGASFIMDVTTSGMACGPVSFKVLYGFTLYKNKDQL